MRTSVILGVVLVVLASPAPAQFFDRLSNPTVPVAIDHPPGLGLTVERIAFGPARGKCADDVAGATLSGFVASGVEVVDRTHLDAILAEHDLSLSGYVDRASAAEIGQVLGPSALLFIKTERCATETDRLVEKESRTDKDRGNYTVTKYTARTRAFLKGSVQAIDLTTGRIFAAKTFDYAPEQSTHSYEGYPDPPPEYEVLDLALNESATYVQRLFLPWTEQRNLIFFNNKKCGLKEAYQQMKAGDYAGAHRMSVTNLDTCRSDPDSKPKNVGRAYYNVGIGHFIEGDYDNAAEYFREAKLNGLGGIASEALDNSLRARELELAMLEIVERAEVAADDEAAAAATAAAKQAAATLSNADVIVLSGSGLPTSIIMAKVRNSNNAFDTSTEALIELSTMGVHEDVIALMIEVATGP